MNSRLTLTVLVLLLWTAGFAQQQKRATAYTIIEGDLYFQMVDFYRFFDAPDSIISKVEAEVARIDLDTVTDGNQEYYGLLKFAVNRNLLRKPFIRLITDQQEKVMLFVSWEDFRQFAGLRCFELREQKKKIRVRAETKEIKYKDLTGYNAVRLVKVEKTEGNTQCIK